MNQISVSKELVELLDFFEVNCTAACCGISAFEINRGLALRIIIDKGDKRREWHKCLKQEVANLQADISTLKINDPEEDVAIRYPTNTELPQYHLQHNELLHLFKRLGIVLKQVEGSNALP
jgi:hypothetical protein